MLTHSLLVNYRDLPVTRSLTMNSKFSFIAIVNSSHDNSRAMSALIFQYFIVREKQFVYVPETCVF